MDLETAGVFMSNGSDGPSTRLLYTYCLWEDSTSSISWSLSLGTQQDTDVIFLLNMGVICNSQEWSMATDENKGRWSVPV